jgi:5-(aminomethyl)-3-furanmethanol phosphate kinase
MRLDAVIKIGGSLSKIGDAPHISPSQSNPPGLSERKLGSVPNFAGLPGLCKEISRLGESHALLVVPGGGEFADVVREAYGRFNLDETTAHSMALLAMDQYGYLLGRLIDGSFLTADLHLACQAAESGRVAVLLPSAAIIHGDPLPHSWEVTSDTIAAWVAHQAPCRRLVLLKDVEGLLSPERGEKSSPRLIAELTVEQLARHAGGVDKYLSKFLSSTHLETWVINGLKPVRLAELLETDHTTGTRITTQSKETPWPSGSAS